MTYLVDNEGFFNKKSKQLILLNGWHYSLKAFVKPFQAAFPSYEVVNHPRMVWNNRSAGIFADSLRVPTILAGFSRGADAALMIAQQSSWVESVWAHSCTAVNPVTHFKRDFPVQFFRTEGDYTPTFAGTEQTFIEYSVRRYKIDLTTLKPVNFIPTSLISALMWMGNHQFHNILPYLDDER